MLETVDLCPMSITASICKERDYKFTSYIIKTNSIRLCPFQYY